MSQPPAKSASTGKKIENAIEKALDPLASALKRATQSAAQAATVRRSSSLSACGESIRAVSHGPRRQRKP